MPEHSPSTAPSPLVAHYIVVGEGARDNEWLHTSSAPLSYSNLSAHQHFQLLQIPPSPTNAIVPVVRIFPSEAKPSYVTKSPTTSLTPAHISPSPSLAVSAPSSHLSPPIHPKHPPTVLGNHGLSASIPTSHAAPRRLSLRGSRMIARPASQPVAPSPPSPPTLNPAHHPVSANTLLAKNTNDIRRSNPTHTSPLPEASAANPTNIPPRKQPSHSTSANDQVRNAQSSLRVDLPSPNNTAKEQLVADRRPASSRAEARSIAARSLKKSISDQIASKAQAAALNDLLKDRKKLYAPVKVLPPLSSVPAAQQLRAARAHSLSPKRQRKDSSTDAAAVSTPVQIALEKAVTGLPVTMNRQSSTSIPRSGGGSSVIPPGIGGLSRGDQEHVETAQAALSLSKVSGKDTNTANVDGHMPIEKRLRQALTTTDCAQASNASVEARVKQEGKRALSTANIDRGIDSTVGSSRSNMEHEASSPHRRNGSTETPGQTSGTTAREKDFPVDPEPADTTHQDRIVDAGRQGQTNLSHCPKVRANETTPNSSITENRQSAASPSGMPVNALGTTQVSCASRIQHPDENCGIMCSETRAQDDKEPTVARPSKAVLPSLAYQGQSKSGTPLAGTPCRVKKGFGGNGESHLRTASTSRSRLGSKGIECSDLLKEPFVFCVKLLVRSLCASGSGSGISKEAATRCRRELRNILKLPKRPQLVDGEKLAEKEAKGVLQNQSVGLGGDNKTGMASSMMLVTSPSSGMNELPQGAASHDGILPSAEKSPGQSLPSGSFRDKVSPRSSLQTTSQAQKADTRSDSTSDSSLINGIRFIFIQWGLSVLKKDAHVEEIARGAREVLKTCNSLKSPLPDSLWIQDEELLVHVLNLNAAASTIHFLLSQMDSLTQETPVGVSKQPSAVKNLEHTLNALRDILVWVRYLTDRVAELWSKYRQGSAQTSEVKFFCEGMERFMKSSSSENQNDGFLSALRDCKKYFPYSKSVVEGKEDGKPFYDRRRSLGREVRSLLPVFGRVCSWCQKQLPTLRSDASPAQGTDESVKRVTGVPQKHPNEVGRRQPSEKVKDVVKAAAPIEASANGTGVPRFAADARTQRENQSPPTRRSSVHDPTVPIKRKSKDISNTSLRKNAVTRDGSRTTIPTKPWSTENALEGTPDSNTSAGRRQVKSSERKGFDPNPMALLKSALGGSNKHLRKDDVRLFSGRPKHTGVTPSSSAMQGQSVAHHRSTSVPTGNLQAEETIGRPLKRRRGQGRVSFVSRLMVGQRDSNIRKEENASLYHDGYDLLGCENAIQESAVRERASQLSRGSMMALFGYLHAEFLQRKNESEARTSPIPNYLLLNYPPSAAKQISRQLESPPLKHPHLGNSQSLQR